MPLKRVNTIRCIYIFSSKYLLQTHDSNQQGKREEMKINHDPNVTQTPQRPTSQNVFSSSHSVLSRIAGEVALTPTNLHTPLYTANPHNTMAAITPAASGCDQAKNSIKIQ